MVHQGAAGSLFGVLVSGELEVTAEGPSGPVVLCRKESGYYFGEAAIMGNTPTTASIIATRKSTVLGLRNRDLLEITKDYPSVKVTRNPESQWTEPTPTQAQTHSDSQIRVSYLHLHAHARTHTRRA